jgi:TPP-dependent pyruvate/acetoin dehydrogenase alpha subunit
MGGSASIQSIEQNIIGHDGLMGSHGPIAVGMCYANKIPTIVFIGDAAAEEDYFLAALGWAVTKNLPMLFIVEDNNLSILTEKKVRRSWDIHKVALGFGIEAYNITDDPKEIINCLNNLFKTPLLLNINTNRMFWHAGAGIDNPKIFCRHTEFSKTLNNNLVTRINEECEILVKTKWKQHLNL